MEKRFLPRIVMAGLLVVAGTGACARPERGEDPVHKDAFATVSCEAGDGTITDVVSPGNRCPVCPNGSEVVEACHLVWPEPVLE